MASFDCTGAFRGSGSASGPCKAGEPPRSPCPETTSGQVSTPLLPGLLGSSDEALARLIASVEDLRAAIDRQISEAAVREWDELITDVRISFELLLYTAKLPDGRDAGL